MAFEVYKIANEYYRNKWLMIVSAGEFVFETIAFYNKKPFYHNVLTVTELQCLLLFSIKYLESYFP